MGAWGLESCSNDSCWDAFIGEDLHSPTDEEIGFSLSQMNPSSEDDEESYLGMIVWGLTHNNTLTPSALEAAKIIAEKLVADEAYLKMWRVREGEPTRQAHLQHEIALISDALANGGKCSKTQEAPEGLMSKIYRSL